MEDSRVLERTCITFVAPSTDEKLCDIRVRTCVHTCVYVPVSRCTCTRMRGLPLQRARKRENMETRRTVGMIASEVGGKMTNSESGTAAAKILSQGRTIFNDTTVSPFFSFPA